MYRRISMSIAAVCLIMILNSSFADVTANIEQAEALVTNYITSGKDAEASDAYQKLITDFAGNPKLPSSVYNVAETYRNASKFDKSLLIYQDLVKKWPVSSQAVWAQRGVTISNIALGKMAEAQTELNKLKQSFSSDPNITEAVFHVADAYYWFGKYGEADGVYKDVAASYPKSDFSMWAQMGLAISAIAQDKDSVAETAKDNLVANFSSNPKLPEALFYIAGRYEYSKKYDKATAIYQQISSQFSQSLQAADARFAIAKISATSLFDSGKVDECMLQVDKLISDFHSHTALAWALSREIAEQRYFYKAFEIKEQNNEALARQYFNNAITIWEKVINQLSSPTEKPFACLWIADSYVQLGDYAKSAQYYQKIVDENPEFEFAWHAQYMVGRNYEKLTKAGLVDEKIAAEKIRMAYEQLLEKYPACKAANLAKRWLNSHKVDSDITLNMRSK